MISISHRRTAAFTLIELLVVIGIIAVLAGIIGGALRGGNPGTALQAGQSTLVSLLANARGQAALNQTRAMLIVDVTDSNDDNYLRAFQVVVESLTTANTWQTTGDVVKLPQGIYLVPANLAALSPAVTLSNSGGAWPPARKSTAVQDSTGQTITGLPTLGSGVIPRYLKFNYYSQFGTITNGQIILAAGQRTSANTISLSNAEAIRGVNLSKYGIATLVNEGASFD